MHCPKLASGLTLAVGDMQLRASPTEDKIWLTHLGLWTEPSAPHVRAAQRPARGRELVRLFLFMLFNYLFNFN